MKQLFSLLFPLLVLAGTTVGQYYQGPATGSIPSGVVITTGEFDVYGQTIFPGPVAKRVHNKIEVEPMPPIPNMPPPTGPEGSNYTEDPSVKLRVSAPPPIPVASFQGIPDQGTSIPPDPHMAAGPNHVIAVVNTRFRIFDKAGNTLRTITAASWFSSALPGCDPFDPKIHYDHHSGRWIQVWLNVNDANQTAHYLVSVSDDSDPIGTWYNWALPAHLNGSSNSGTWSDYQGVGFDDQALYFTANQFSWGSVFQYTKVRIIGKAQLYANTAGAVTWTDFWDLRDLYGNNSFGVRPTIVHGAPGVYYLVNIPNVSYGTYFVLYRITNPLTSPAITGVHISVVAWSIAPNASQLGGGMLLEGGRSQLRNEPTYRDSAIWAAHSVASGPGNLYSSVRYVRINTIFNSAVEDEAMGAEGFWHTYTAITTDKDKNVFVTYSRSGLTEYAGAYMSWHTDTDPPGLQPSHTIQAGKANYVKDFGSGRNRWGDYNGIALDPVERNNVWMLTEYAEAPSSTWGTWIYCSRVVPLPGRRIYANPTSLDFGNREANITSDTLSFKIASVGSSALTVNSISNSNTTFSLVGLPSLPRTINSFDSINVKVVYRPTAHGVVTDSVVIVSNDSLSSTTKIYLRGKGFIIGRTQVGVMYAASGTPTSQLYSINLANGTPTLIGPTSVAEIQDLAIRPTTGEIYGTLSSASNTSIYRVSAQYGEALLVRTVPVTNMRAIAFSPGDTLYGATTSGRLYRINLNTGDTVGIGTSAGILYSSLSFSPTSRVLWASVRPPTGVRDRVYTVNISNGSTTLIGSTGFAIITAGIAFHPSGALYGLTGTGTQTNNFITIDTLTAVGTLVGSTGMTGLTAIAMRTDSSVVSVHELPNGSVPTTYRLEQNFPNPFNPVTSIRYDLPEEATVSLRVYNILGQQVRELINILQPAGSYEASWDGTWSSGADATSGVYFYKIEAMGKTRTFEKTGKMVMLR